MKVELTTEVEETTEIVDLTLQSNQWDAAERWCLERAGNEAIKRAPHLLDLFTSQTAGPLQLPQRVHQLATEIHNICFHEDNVRKILPKKEGEGCMNTYNWLWALEWKTLTPIDGTALRFSTSALSRRSSTSISDEVSRMFLSHSKVSGVDVDGRMAEMWCAVSKCDGIFASAAISVFSENK